MTIPFDSDPSLDDLDDMPVPDDDDGISDVDDDADEPADAAPVGAGPKPLPNLKDILVQRGFDPEEAAKLDRVYLHRGLQSRTVDALRQELATTTQRLQNLEMNLAQGLKADGSGNGTKTAVDRYIEEHSAGDESGETAKFLTGLVKAIRDDFVVAPEMQQLRQSVQDTKFDRVMADEYQALSAQYGPKLKSLWPQVKQLVRQYLAQGIVVDANAVLTKHFPDQTLALLGDQRSRKRKRQAAAAASDSLEGFVKTRTTRAMPSISDTGRVPRDMGSKSVAARALESMRRQGKKIPTWE